MPDLRFWLAFVEIFTAIVFGLMALALIIEYWPWKRGK